MSSRLSPLSSLLLLHRWFLLFVLLCPLLLCIVEGDTTMSCVSERKGDFRDKVCIIGSGNWGSAIATIVGPNCERLSDVDSTVHLWVYEEMVKVPDATNGNLIERKLSEVINERNENVKYLPGVKLPKNVIAEPDLATACQNATLLIFVMPHQFLPPVLPTIRESVHPTHCRGVSLIKGLGTYRTCIIEYPSLRLH